MLNKTNNNVFTNWVETRIKSSSIPPYAIWNGYSLLTLFYYSEDSAAATERDLYLHLLFAKTKGTVNCDLNQLFM